MSIRELENEIRELSREEQDRIAAFLTYLRLKGDGELSDQDEEFVSWKTVRDEFKPSDS
jgi:hypothetical protein